MIQKKIEQAKRIYPVLNRTSRDLIFFGGLIYRNLFIKVRKFSVQKKHSTKNH